MKPFILRILFLLTMHFLSLSLFAQKQFRLTVDLPEAINPGKMEAWLENGKDAKKIKPLSVTGKQMVLKGDSYATYAAITLHYPPDSSANGFAKTFFIGEKPGVIAFTTSRSTGLPFTSYSLQNVLDFEKEKKQMDDFSAAERKKAMDYETRYGEKIFSGTDTAIRNPYFKVLMPALRRKKLEYIINHRQSYYSFYVFRTEVAKPMIASWDSLLSVFNSFPHTFKYSDEGNYLNAFLHGKLASQKSDAIDFVAKALDKKTVALSQFKGRKTVLLHFWATWCTPCMRELPAVKEISTLYKAKDLQIISIALPSLKYADYLATINKLQMNWIHVYDDPALQNKYGNEPIPRICLIDKTGKLIYDSLGLEKKEDVQLNGLREKLKEIMQD